MSIIAFEGKLVELFFCCKCFVDNYDIIKFNSYSGIICKNGKNLVYVAADGFF